MMKPSSIFMNIGRGVTVKERFLVDAPKTKVIEGAVLDVFEVEPLFKESELWEMPNVLMTTMDKMLSTWTEQSRSSLKNLKDSRMASLWHSFVINLLAIEIFE